MPAIEETVFIAKSPEEVFDFLHHAENIPVWDSSIMQAEQLGADPIGVGTRLRGVSKVLGRRFEWTTEVIEFEPPTLSSSRAVEGSLHFTVTNSLQPEEGGTRLTYRIDADSGLGGIFGRLADPFVAKAQGRTVRANLDTLAELLSHSAT
jgi:carbon monoxide dehydrogenase subunit G